MKYWIYDNKNNKHIIEAANDQEAIETLKKTYYNYIVSVLSNNNITMYPENGRMIAQVETATGAATVYEETYWSEGKEEARRFETWN